MYTLLISTEFSFVQACGTMQVGAYWSIFTTCLYRKLIQKWGVGGYARVGAFSLDYGDEREREGVSCIHVLH